MRSLPALAWLLPAPQLSGADTVLVRQVAAEPTWFAITVGIAQIIIAVAILAVVLVALLTWLSVMRKLRQRGGTLGSILHNVKALARRANRVAGTINRLGDLAMENAKKVDRTVDDATERVTRLFDGAERHVHALDSMVDVAREEAQDALITSVAAVRGLRAGARTMRTGDGASGVPRAGAGPRRRAEAGADANEPATDDHRAADDDEPDDGDFGDEDDWIAAADQDDADEDFDEQADADEDDLDDDEFEEDDLEYDDDDELDGEDEDDMADTAERARFERALERFDRDLLYGSYVSGEFDADGERRRQPDRRADTSARSPRPMEESTHDRSDEPGRDVERPRRRPRA